MKLTKEQLKRIIKEELSKVMKESSDWKAGIKKSVFDHIKSKESDFYLNVDDETLGKLVDNLFNEKEMNFWMQKNLDKSPADYANYLMGEIDDSNNFKEFFGRKDWEKIVTNPAEERDSIQRQKDRSDSQAARQKEHQKQVLIQQVVRAAQDKDEAKLAELLKQLGLDVNANILITKIKNILDDQSLDHTHDKAIRFVEDLIKKGT